jgi:hypothetical protein
LNANVETVRRKKPGTESRACEESLDVFGRNPKQRCAGLPAAATATAATAAAATTAESTTTTAAAAAEAATAATAAATLARPGLVDGEVATVNVLAVEGRDGRASVLVIRELDETEAAGAAGFTVHDQRRRRDFAVSREQLAQLALGGIERQISYVELHTASTFLLAPVL